MDIDTITPVRDEIIRGFVVDIPARNIRTAMTVTFGRVQDDR